MGKKVIRFFMVTALALVVLISSIPISSLPVYAAKKPVLSKTKLTMTVGEKKTLKVKNISGKTKVTWKSSKKSVATVSKKGVITAKKKGSTVISVKIKGRKKPLTCKVTVKLPKLQISQTEAVLLYGDAIYLDVNDAVGKVTWKSSNPEILEIEQNDGYIFATSKKVGETTITAKTKTQKAVSCKVRVGSRGLYLVDENGNKAPYSSGTYDVNSVHDYKVFYDGTEIPTGDVTWKSLNEEVAKVSDGKVSMVGEGTTYICATDKDGNTAYAYIWVSKMEDEWSASIPQKGLFFEGMFIGYGEHILEHMQTEGEYFFIWDVYDDGEKIDAKTLTWSVEDLKGHPFELGNAKGMDEDGTVGIQYTQEIGQAFLVATNPATGHSFRYLIMTYDR